MANRSSNAGRSEQFQLERIPISLRRFVISGSSIDVMVGSMLRVRHLSTNVVSIFARSLSVSGLVSARNAMS